MQKRHGAHNKVVNDTHTAADWVEMGIIQELYLVGVARMEHVVNLGRIVENEVQGCWFVQLVIVFTE
jgi:hypothetical protein